jgi:predicted glycosyltransferase involved in capsule biosynthesis
MDDTAYILTFRESGSAERRDNLLAIIQRLERLPLLEVIVFEQDRVPRLEVAATPSHRRVLFGYNPEPFNKSWGFNVAARQTARPTLVFADADVVVDEALDQAIAACRHGIDAAKPYRRITDLTRDESRRFRERDRDFVPNRPAESPPDREAQREFVVFAGGVFVIGREAYLRLGGFDERFLGWGGEDNAMSIKLERTGMRLAEYGECPALHLWHPREH